MCLFYYTSSSRSLLQGFDDSVVMDGYKIVQTLVDCKKVSVKSRIWDFVRHLNCLKFTNQLISTISLGLKSSRNSKKRIDETPNNVKFILIFRSFDDHHKNRNLWWWPLNDWNINTNLILLWGFVYFLLCYIFQQPKLMAETMTKK